MRRTNANVMIALLAGSLTSAGCGSGSGSGGTGGAGGAASGKSGAGGSGAGACQPLIPGDGTATWLANGVSECATITVAEHDVATLADTFEFVGATTTGVGIGLTVSVYTGSLGGTYSCKGDGGAGAPYVSIVNGGASSIDDCTITIDSAGAPGGAHATGTFSATGTAASGGPISLTNGQFDTPVTTTGG
jgi:hypothetical protein